VAGILTTLALNISNSKYNGLMRIINASIPNFEHEAEEQEVIPSKKMTMPPNHPTTRQRQPSNVGAMQLPSNLFVNSLTQEYTIEEEPQEKTRHLNRGKICKRDWRKQNRRRHSNSRLKSGRYKRHSLRRMLPAWNLCSQRLCLNISPVDQVRDNRGLIIKARSQ
jgi:hypothetical protein